MKRIFAIVVISIVLYSCKPGVPSDVIQPDKMEKVLYDIHMVDGYIGALQKPDTAKIVASSYYKGIYKKFDIDSVVYNQSLDYYYQRPDLLNKMFENMMKQFDEERKRNEKRLNDEVLAKQKKELAKSAKVLVVTHLPSGPPTFNFRANPFTLIAAADQ